MRNQRPSSSYGCPSAQPDMEEARVDGLVSGTPTVPRIAYLAAKAEIDLATVPDMGPVAVTQVFRIAARCEEHRCAQFADGRCSLGKRIVDGVSPVVDALPPC